jgi:flagellar basal body-associated protein FliL
MILLALALIVFIIAGTIYAFVRVPGSAPLFRIGGAAAEVPARAAAAEGLGVFAGIGRLRIPLTGTSTMILSIAFPYPASDRAFTEELASKIGDFRALATDYFSALPAEKIVNLDEEAAKAEILKRYNASLRLGAIEALYFNDLMIIE